VRTKQEILEATHRNALKASGAKDISLIHSLHMLEIVIDIRDTIEARLKSLDNTILKCFFPK